MTTSQNPILIVGATGTVGRRLGQQLARQGESVRAATRTPARYESPAAGIEAVPFDYKEPETYARALGSARRVFMMAPSDTEAYRQLTGFVDAAEEADVEHVVFMTAMGVDQAPSDMPLRRAELYLQDSGLAHTILRPNWFMQNFLTYWRGMIEADGILRLPADDAATSFIDASDIAAVAAAALTHDGHDGRGYTLTGPEALTYHEAAEILSEASGRAIRYEPVGDDEARRIFTNAGLDDDYAGMLVGLFQNVKAGNAAPVTPDVKQVAGRPPRSLEQFVAAHADAWS